jgi:hypothetical protein
MVSSQDEFVLLLKKWRSDSAKVGLVFRTEASSEMPLSTAMVLRVWGTIEEISEAESFVVLKIGQSGLVSIGFANSFFNFNTSFLGLDTKPVSNFVDPDREVDELATVRTASGLMVTLYTLIAHG